MTLAGGGRRLWLLAFCQFLLSAGNALAFPFLAIYLGEKRGVPAHEIGAILSLFVLATAAGQGLGGWASDLWGRKRVMLGALAARTVLVAALSKVVASGALSTLIVVHLLYSLLGSAFQPASQSWVADQYSPRRRLEAYSLLRVAPNLGFAIGPALGSLAPLSSYPSLFAISAATTFVCAALVGAFIPEAPRLESAAPSLEDAAGARTRADRRFLSYCAWTIMLSLAAAQLVVGLSLYATRFLGLSHREVGLLFSLNGFMVVFLQTWLTRRFSEARLTAFLAAGGALYALGYGSVAFAGGFAGLIASVGVITLGEISVAPAMSALAANLAPPGRRGRYIGWHGLAYQLGWSMGPATGGLGLRFLGPLDPRLLWLFIGGLAALAARGFYGLRPWLSPEEDRPSYLPAEA